MRNKAISIALLVIIIGAFFMPLTAYATELDDVEFPTASSMKEEPGGTTAPVATSTPEPAEPMVSNGAFTPEGQAEVVDWVLSYDGKEFYTITTLAGNIFYLIIDHARANNNVYFLNAVTESDLIALAEKAGALITAGAVETPSAAQSPTADADEPGDTEQPTPGEAETPPKESNDGNNGMIIFVVIAALAIGGAGYYIKIVRPKRQAAIDDDDEDEPEDDEDIPFDDEAEDDDGHTGEDDDYIYPDDEDIEENDNMKEDDEDEQT